jgi:hypothetical protein
LPDAALTASSFSITVLTPRSIENCESFGERELSLAKTPSLPAPKPVSASAIFPSSAVSSA